MFGGKGNIDIRLDRNNFSAGETIEGIVTVNLNKNIKAKGLFIEMYGEEVRRDISSGHNSKRINRIYNFELSLDSEKEYPKTEEPLVYPFKIKVPEDVSNQEKVPDGIMGTMVQAMNFLSKRNVNWYLSAKLDIPMAGDINKRIQINIA